MHIAEVVAEVRLGKFSPEQACAALDPDEFVTLEDLGELLEAALRESTPALVYDIAKVLLHTARHHPPIVGVDIAVRAGLRILGWSQERGSLELFELALAGIEDKTTALATAVYGYRLHCLNDAGRAADVVREAPAQLERAQRLGDVEEELRTRLSYAAALSRQGAHSAAQAELVAAAGTLEQGHLAPASVAAFMPRFLGVQAEAARSASRFPEALNAFSKLADLHRAAGRMLPFAYATSELGVTWQQMGDPAQGDVFLQQAAQVARAEGDREAATRWLTRSDDAPVLPENPSAANLNAYLTKLLQKRGGDFDQMRLLGLAAVKNARESGLAALEIMSRNILGAVYDAADRPRQALAAFEAAVDVSQRSGEQAFEIYSRTNLVRALFKTRQMDQAIAYGMETLELAHRWRMAANNAEVRQSMAVSLAHLYGHLATLYGNYWVGPGGNLEPSPTGLFTVAQHCQALNFLGWLVLEDSIESKPDAAFRRSVRSLRAIETRIERLAAGGADISRELVDCERERRRLFPSNEGTDPVGRFPIFTVDELLETLPERSGIVDLHCCPSGVACAFITKGGGKHAVLVRWPEAERLAFTSRWAASLRAERARIGAAREWRSHDSIDVLLQIEDAPPSLESLVLELEERLFEPLAELLRKESAEHLYVVPHDELYLVPMSVLEEVLEGITVSILPAPGAARLITRRARSKGGQRYKIGDGTGTLACAGVELALLPGYTPLDPGSTELVERLSSAHRLHFAGHGIFEPRQPYDSGLLLGTPRAGSDDSSGWRLTIAKLLAEAALESCELVVLSGCSTGQSRLHRANEFTSLPGALLVAGARQVVASLWPAHDGACVVFMKHFYEALASEPAPVAVKKARAALKATERGEAVLLIGSEEHVPVDPTPFASPMFTHVFQHYGAF